jgi:hypothetical protein
MSTPTLTTRNATLDDLARLLKDQHAVKVDVVAPATAIRAVDGQIVLTGAEPEITEDGVTPGDGIYTPTEICDTGIAEKLGIPIAYLRRLRADRLDLYDANLNGWLHGRDGAAGRHAASEALDPVPSDPRKFLVRCFRGDDGDPGIARAFLSDRYSIMDNLDVLMAALDGVKRAGVAVDIDGCDLTEKRMYVRVSAPEIKAYAPALLAGYRSPFDGRDVGDGWTPERVANVAGREGQAHNAGGEPIVFAGFVISNSETGGGAFTLTPRLVVEVCGNGLQIVADAQRGIHLGSRLGSGVVDWSADTQRRALHLVTAKTRDAVRAFLQPAYVAGKVAELEELAGKPVTDATTTIATIGKKLAFSEMEQATILDHFIRGGQLTAGGILQAITSAAQTVENADTAHDMESRALRALELV